MSKPLLIVLAAISALVAADFDLYKGCNGSDQKKMCIGFDAEGKFTQKCIEQKNCMFAASLSIMSAGSLHMEVLSSYTGSDDGNHWVAVAVSEDEKVLYARLLISKNHQLTD